MTKTFGDLTREFKIQTFSAGKWTSVASCDTYAQAEQFKRWHNLRRARIVTEA